MLKTVNRAPRIPGARLPEERVRDVEFAKRLRKLMAERELTTAGLPATIVVDCSHGNSNKDPSLQPLVAENCVAQILEGNKSIVGLMLESHLRAGRQAIPKDLSQLEYGLSITDPCIDWQATEQLLLRLHKSLQTYAS